MTSATPTVLPLPPAADRGSPAKPVTIWRVIQSEWIKFSTLRSTWITLAFAVLGVVGIGAIITAVTASNWDSQDAASVATFDTFDPIGTSLTGVVLAQLIMAVMGVLIVTGEYATGMIRASLAAVPRRLMLLSGKITVAAVVSLTVSLIATFAAFLIGQQLLGDHGTTLDAPGVLRAVFGSALYLSSIAVIAAAIGFIVRSTAGGVAATLGLLLVLPLLSDSIPNDWVARALQYLPSEAGMAIYLGSAGWGSDFTLTRAVTTVMAWVVVTIAGAAVVLVRRDA